MLRVGLVQESVFSINEHILTVVGPAPGGIDLYGSPGIFHDYGCVIINAGILIRLIALQDCIDARRSLAVKEPGGEVCTIAAEVHDCTASVEHRVCQPVQELLAAADLDRALMSVINLDTVDGADFTSLYRLFYETVRGVPGCFVVGKQQYSMPAGKCSHPPCIL